jgi:transcription initiation factor TFIIIB Brf1 subunit/transcription initiation factor TFIIB
MYIFFILLQSFTKYIKVDINTLKDKMNIYNTIKMSGYTMTGVSMDISNIDIKKLNKIFEGIDFMNNNKVDNYIDLNICQTCESDNIVEDSSQGIRVCKDCGQVSDVIYDSNPEWKQFDEDDKGGGGRCNMASNPLLPISSLGTMIGGFGKTRLKTLHSWNAMPYRERRLNNEFKKMHEICQRGGILKCVEDDAQIMYKIANDCKHLNGTQKNKYVITRGINRVGISANCMFLSCLKSGVTRTSKEIAALYGIKDSDMNKGFKTLLRFLKIGNVNLNIGTSKAEHFVKRYCNELKIKNVYIAEAIKISQNVEKLNIASDHTPYSVAAASILLMAESFNLKSVTKKKIAYEFSLSEVTIAKTFKEIEACKSILSNTLAVNDIVNQINLEIIEEETSPEILERMRKFNIEPTSNSIGLSNIISASIQIHHTKISSNYIEKLKNNFDLETAQNLLDHFKSVNKKIREDCPIKL